MSLRINAEAPNFEAETTHGWINFHEWMGSSWAILFSHPKDFTPVCTTELGYVASLEPKFTVRNTKVIGLSIDPVAKHHEWAKDIEMARGDRVGYPIIADPDLTIAKLYDMLPADVGDARYPTDTATVRAVFVISPDKRVKASINYPQSTGRNFDEVLRLLDSCQLTERFTVATPANWRHGEDVIILPHLSDEEAREKYPEGWRAPLPYLRLVPDPSFGVDWFSNLDRR